MQTTALCRLPPIFMQGLPMHSKRIAGYTPCTTGDRQLARRVAGRVRLAQGRGHGRGNVVYSQSSVASSPSYPIPNPNPIHHGRAQPPSSEPEARNPNARPAKADLAPTRSSLPPPPPPTRPRSSRSMVQSGLDPWIMAEVPRPAACSVPRGDPLLRTPHRSLTATLWAQEERRPAWMLRRGCSMACAPYGACPKAPISLLPLAYFGHADLASGRRPQGRAHRVLCRWRRPVRGCGRHGRAPIALDPAVR